MSMALSKNQRLLKMSSLYIHVVEEVLKFYIPISTDLHSISRKGDRERINRPKFPDRSSKKKPGEIYISFRVCEDVWKSFREFVEKSGENAGDAVDRALKLYLGASQSTFAWIGTYIPSTPDYVRSLVNVVYDFNLPTPCRDIGMGSGVRVVPVEGDAGKEVVACIVREELPDDSSAIPFQKRGIPHGVS